MNLRLVLTEPTDGKPKGHQVYMARHYSPNGYEYLYALDRGLCYRKAIELKDGMTALEAARRLWEWLAIHDADPKLRIAKPAPAPLPLSRMPPDERELRIACMTPSQYVLYIRDKERRSGARRVLHFAEDPRASRRTAS